MTQQTTESEDLIRENINRLQSELKGLDDKKIALELELRTLENKLRRIAEQQHRIWEHTKNKKRITDHSKKVLVKDLLSNTSHNLALRIAGAVYLQEYYLKILKVMAGYKSDQNHNEQLAPVYHMLKVIAKIGACIQIFTTELLATKPFNQAMFEQNKALTEELHPIWDLAHCWKMCNDSELMSPGEVSMFFSELLAPHEKNIHASKQALNATYFILYGENVWENLEK